MDLYIWENGLMIIFMGKEFIFFRIIRDIREKCIKDLGKARVFFIIRMEGYIKDNGWKIRNMVLVSNKEIFCIRVNGKKILNLEAVRLFFLMALSIKGSFKWIYLMDWDFMKIILWDMKVVLFKVISKGKGK